MFRELTRKNKQLTPDECLEVLKNETRGVLSVIGDGGYPYGMPMNHWYHEADGNLYFHCGIGGHRTESLEKCDKVSFCVMEQGVREEGGWALKVRSVIVFGRMEVLDDPAAVVEITTNLSHKFTQDEAYIREEIRKYAKGTRLLRLIPEHICGKMVIES